MKKVKDPGLVYLQKLRINRAKGAGDMTNIFERKFGEAGARDYLMEMDRLIDEGTEAEKYEWKNHDFEKSILYTGSADAEIFRKSCNWIFENKGYFGDHILDIGCDCGIMTCFLALTFPNAEITSIDRRINSLKVAQELASRFNITNVKFMQGDVCDLAKDLQKFDTVFSMRTIHENGIDLPNPGLMDLEGTMQYEKETIKDYVRILVSLLSENGRLISIERASVDPLFLAILHVLNENSITILKDTYKELVCDEMSKKSWFQAAVYEHGERKEAEEITAFWGSALNIDFHATKFDGWRGDFIMEGQKEKEVRRSVHVYDGEHRVGRFYLYLADGKSCFFFNNNTPEGHFLIISDASYMEDINYRIDGFVQDNLRAGFKVVEE